MNLNWTLSPAAYFQFHSLFMIHLPCPAAVRDSPVYPHKNPARLLCGSFPCQAPPAYPRPLAQDIWSHAAQNTARAVSLRPGSVKEADGTAQACGRQFNHRTLLLWKGCCHLQRLSHNRIPCRPAPQIPRRSFPCHRRNPSHIL